jgi:hypothetical protein
MNCFQKLSAWIIGNVIWYLPFAAVSLGLCAVFNVSTGTLKAVSWIICREQTVEAQVRVFNILFYFNIH